VSATVQASWLQGASATLGETSAAQAAALGVGTVLGGIDVVRVGIALACCLVLGIAAIVFLRRSQGIARQRPGAADARRIHVVEKARLDTRATLYLVECDQRTVLLVADANGVKLLDANRSATLEPGA